LNYFIWDKPGRDIESAGFDYTLIEPAGPSAADPGIELCIPSLDCDIAAVTLTPSQTLRSPSP
jgi:hypothetical protein